MPQWRFEHEVLRRSLATLSTYDTVTWRQTPESFEAVEFNLLIEDMTEALEHLYRTCEKLEHHAAKHVLQAPALAPLKRSGT
jgi:hypothetical protein